MATIKTIGTYTDIKNTDFTIWMGEADDCFMYVPLVLGHQYEYDASPSIVNDVSLLFRFSPSFDNIEEAEKNGIAFAYHEGLPGWMIDKTKKAIETALNDPHPKGKNWDIPGLKEKLHSR